MTADLGGLQRLFARGLSGPESGPASDLLKPLKGRPPRLDIYRHAYRARLVAALRSNYPVLHRVLGDEDFEALALDYLAHRPHRQPSIRWFGDALAEHLADAPDRRVPHPALIDLVRMEWALGSSFDAADATALDAGALAGLAADDWPALRLRPHPSVRLVPMRWAVEPIWQALTADHDAATAEPEALAHDLLVWRQGLDTHWRSLPDAEARLLRAALRGEPLSAWSELAAIGQAAPAAAQIVATQLQRWVADGLLCDTA